MEHMFEKWRKNGKVWTEAAIKVCLSSLYPSTAL